MLGTQKPLRYSQAHRTQLCGHLWPFKARHGVIVNFKQSSSPPKSSMPPSAESKPLEGSFQKSVEVMLNRHSPSRYRSDSRRFLGKNQLDLNVLTFVILDDNTPAFIPAPLLPGASLDFPRKGGFIFEARYMYLSELQGRRGRGGNGRLSVQAAERAELLRGALLKLRTALGLPPQEVPYASSGWMRTNRCPRCHGVGRLAWRAWFRVVVAVAGLADGLGEPHDWDGREGDGIWKRGGKSCKEASVVHSGHGGCKRVKDRRLTVN
ncbi:hypothetical protein VOLCADRAFT_85773 [Volvox carteri f. nagariensis]|uniref:Uncharacterized protein n=1 Tax=Volvox carteri f. nagariensis TaxID=3068 RepID=D8TGY1_VOLCA|nr:uncharacterized protein VOLCADRAFT_85773 [Volvox carteri f. nagariensis]EFJ52612.1 hypothetical protein VOLCADRAFT_85773 [Volvox carteri f. nagariensis]|eukprot:XP_002945617.1 hypothetical protein VOLCADRAFT_85773 [Volvox carteri f. nagariensis]